MNQVRDADLKKLFWSWNRDMVEIRDNLQPTTKNINRFITLNYCQLIVTRLRERLEKEKGDYYEPERLIAHLKRQNWKQYSFSGKGFEGDTLIKVISGWYVNNDIKMPKKEREDEIGLLVIQSYYLEEACRMIIDILEVW